MRKVMPWEWERLDDKTARAKVIGGWIILHLQSTFATGEFGKKTNVKIVNSESMVFLADRDHEWTISKPVVETPPPAKTKVDPKDFENKQNPADPYD
jgi:hypothetical protein